MPKAKPKPVGRHIHHAVGQDRLTARQDRAAVLYAQGELSIVSIGEQVGCTPGAIKHWVLNPLFAARVNAIRDEIAGEAMRLGVAHTVNRLRRLNRDWQRLQQIIEDRAKAAIESGDKRPGASTGLMCDQEIPTRIGSTTVYQRDDALLAELRAIEERAARETTQDRLLVTTDNALRIEVVYSDADRPALMPPALALEAADAIDAPFSVADA